MKTVSLSIFLKYCIDFQDRECAQSRRRCKLMSEWCFYWIHHISALKATNPEGSYAKLAAKKGHGLVECWKTLLRVNLKCDTCTLQALSGPDVPCMGLQVEVCPALRAESSSSSLYSASMVSFPSPKLPSCCSWPWTLIMYFFFNNACPVLQAAALASVHIATIKCWQNWIWLCFVRIGALGKLHEILPISLTALLTHALLFLQPVNQLTSWEALFV